MSQVCAMWVRRAVREGFPGAHDDQQDADIPVAGRAAAELGGVVAEPLESQLHGSDFYLRRGYW